MSPITQLCSISNPTHLYRVRKSVLSHRYLCLHSLIITTSIHISPLIPTCFWISAMHKSLHFGLILVAKYDALYLKESLYVGIPIWTGIIKADSDMTLRYCHFGTNDSRSLSRFNSLSSSHLFKGNISRSSNPTFSYVLKQYFLIY